MYFRNTRTLHQTMEWIRNVCDPVITTTQNCERHIDTNRLYKVEMASNLQDHVIKEPCLIDSCLQSIIFNIHEYNKLTIKKHLI